MWAQLMPDLKLQGRRLLLTLTLISLFFGKAILRAWKAVRPTLVFVLNVLAALFPDREVTGIYCGDLVLGLGTLHCMTMQQPTWHESPTRE